MRENNIIKDKDMVKVKKVGNEIIVCSTNTCNHKTRIKKLSGNKHLVLSTGEIVESAKSQFRGDNLRSILESQNNLKDLIKENVVNMWKTLSITLTYDNPTLDKDKISKDFKVFIRYLRSHFTDYGEIEYINTLELNEFETGYHIHVVLLFNKSTKSVFLPLQTLNQAWRNGLTSLGKYKRKSQLYCYLAPHGIKEVNNENKHFGEKAERVSSLPAGINLYHYSRGLKKPKVYTDTYENVKRYIKENKCTLISEQCYKNPMPALWGNNLFYKREIYSEEKKSKRTKI